jgi:hypothetical protein
LCQDYKSSVSFGIPEKTYKTYRVHLGSSFSGFFRGSTLSVFALITHFVTHALAWVPAFGIEKYQLEETEKMEEENKCCFCGERCKIESQSCGRCAREITGYHLGWNPKPQVLQTEKNIDLKKEAWIPTIISKTQETTSKPP